MNESPPGYDDHVRARLHLSRTAKDTADYARSLVPTYADDHASTGEWITAARRLRLLAERAIDAAILLELARGATRADLVAMLALPADVIDLRISEVTKSAARISPADAVADLDRWYARTGGSDAPTDAVSRDL